MECSRRLFLKKCGCQPYFYPIRGKDMKVCGIHDVDCSFDASKMAQMLAFPSSSVQIELNELGLLCSCPSSCNEVIYSIETSSAPFPSEMAYQSSETIQQTVAKGKGKVDLRFLQRKEPQTRSTHQMHLTANKPESAISCLHSNLAIKQAFDELFDKR
ncbi:uncharacterized protein LOC131878338 isoform X4 [Tigriopus californicus]|uniref:uncharacterized protein LOC131878338 isoform X4 n=1 Tax=Tigriopus californicus TaxID=6832 RepID=UPI0027DA1D90|nr:uncharacterized protein LOC131878338 isoform X4 [Tigriopus californicus]